MEEWKAKQQKRTALKWLNIITYVLGVIFFFIAAIAYVVGGGERNLATFSWPLLATCGVTCFFSIWFSRSRFAERLEGFIFKMFFWVK